MSKPIHDQLAVVQRMMERQLHTTAEGSATPDQFRVLASLAETQAHLVRALAVQSGEAVRADEPPPKDDFDEARLFDMVGEFRVVEWERDDWCCPACGGDRFLLDGAPQPSEARPSKDKRFVRADLTATCGDDSCGFHGQVGVAALSWHRERMGFDALPVVAEWKETHLT
jgi:hypothetical protein